jgi:WD40 repeat protein
VATKAFEAVITVTITASTVMKGHPMISHVKAEISKRQLRLAPDDSPRFVAENERSEREFDELWAHGTEEHPKVQWYEVEPDICAKKPPGARTTFHVVITKAPIPTYDTNVDLTVRVFSVDADHLSTEEKVLLAIAHPQKSLKLFLPIEELTVYPGNRLDIPALVYNLSPRSRAVTVRLLEIDKSWFSQGIEKEIHLGAGESEKVEFSCIPPRSPNTKSTQYNFTAEVFETAAEGNINSESASGSIEVLPYGSVRFDCVEQLQRIPGREAYRGDIGACYDLQFENQSGSDQQVNIKVEETNQKPFKSTFPQDLKLKTAEERTVSLQIEKARAWLGREQRLFLQVTPSLTHPESGMTNELITSNPTTRTLELRVRPLVPFWLQLIGGLVGLLWLLILAIDSGKHGAPVNSVRLISNSATVVSGSSDATIQRWQVLSWLGNRLWKQEKIANDTTRAVRVIREIPAHEGEIAAGLENGDIQLWRVSPPDELKFNPEHIGDRVFDLAFTQDSQYLFSAHGSSTIRQWAMQSSLSSRDDTLTRPFKKVSIPNTAISALAVSDQGNQPWVAIAGQYNRLALWSPTKKIGQGSETIYVFNYSWDKLSELNPGFELVSGQYDYINSLAIAKGNPNILVTADNKGLITTWSISRLQSCALSQNSSLESAKDTFKNTVKFVSCEGAILAQWNAGGEKHQSVNAIAITQDGRYLVSAGDEGKILLWQLDENGQLTKPSPLRTKFLGTRLKSVDIQQPDKQHVLIASDAPGNQVKLYSEKVESNDSQ